jgi:hypothetical protein
MPRFKEPELLSEVTCEEDEKGSSHEVYMAVILQTVVFWVVTA